MKKPACFIILNFLTLPFSLALLAQEPIDSIRENDVSAILNFLSQRLLGKERKWLVTVAMIHNQVPIARYPAYYIRRGADRFSANTKCRTNFDFLQKVQQSRCDIWLWTIVEA